MADATIRERHHDETVITDHPVEQGAQITDHAYVRPRRVSIEVGFSNSSIQAGGDPNYVNEIYQDFLMLQGSRQPFEIITGKAFYRNMLIERLTVTTDERTENVLMLTVDCREVIRVSTSVVTVSNSNLANQPSNAVPTGGGTVAANPTGGGASTTADGRILVTAP